MLLNSSLLARIFSGMTHHIKTLKAACCITFVATAALADCTAVYKAKQDNPLRLEHGSLAVSGTCTKEAAKAKVKAELASKGWTLLKVLSVSEN